MEYTTNYQLPTWAESDRVLMDDFNDMTEKLETALTGHGEALAGKGNCQIYTASYVGTGVYGNTNQNSLVCPFPPQMIIIHSNNGGIAFGFNPTSRSGGMGAVASEQASFRWSGNTVSWFGTSAMSQMNTSGLTYYVIILMAAA